ncbi:MAG: PAS domain S-box protein [Gemmatimonadota bacterium]|nr:PAS domain S-box protein [Gemmatimonadota bacterium]
MSESLREWAPALHADDWYRALADSMDEGFCVVEVLFDEQGRPQDYRFVELNPAFEKLTGLERAAGRTARELVPDLEQRWIEVYGRIASTGEAIRFTDGSDAMHRWFDVNAFPIGPPERRRVGILFTNLTERKQADADARFLADLSERLRQAVAADELLEAVNSALGAYLRASRCYFAEIFSAEDRWMVRRDYHAGGTSIAGDHRISAFDPEVLAAMRAGQVLVADDTRTDPRSAEHYAGTYEPLGVRAHVIVPLLREGHWTSNLVVASDRPRQWEGREVGLLETVAERTWNAVERLRLDAGLRESEARFRGLAESMSQFAWIADGTGWIFWYNQRWFEYTGTTLEQMQGWGWKQVHHPEHVDRVVDRVQRSWETGEPWEDTFPLRGRDGNYRWFLSRALPVRDAAGDVVRWFGTNTDVTELRTAQEALRAGEATLRMALETGRLGQWELAVASGGLEASVTSKATFGFDPHEPLTFGRFLELVHPDDRSRVQEAVRRTLEAGCDYEVEHRVIWPDGTEHWLLARGRAARAADGTIDRMRGVTLDITDRKRSEEQLRQMDRLEAVGVLAGGVAHEANNQMSVVLGFAGFILKRDDLPDEVRADVQQVQRAAERTALVTAQLLAFGRRQILQPEVLDLNAVVGGMHSVLARTLGETAKIVLALAPDLGPVRADAAQVEQVLVNLALNARDAMPEGGTLTVRTANVKLGDATGHAASGEPIPAGRYIRLEVRDTGCGMTPEVRRRIFEPFFTTKAVGSGTGLGLSTVYGIVKQSDGYVEVESEPGGGTGFILHFPRTPTANEAAASPAEPAGSLGGAGETVLIVEDDPLVRAMAGRTLGEAGYRVLEAEDGQAAIELLARTESWPDVVVTDLAMPRMDGKTLAARLHALQPALPVIFMSGYADDEVVRRGLMTEGGPSLQKPFSPDRLAAALHAALRGRLRRPEV